MHALLESRTLWWCSYSISRAYTLYYVYHHAKEGLRYGGHLRQYNYGSLVYLLSGAVSLHHLAIMTKPSLSCLLCFLCMLAIPIIPLFKMRRFFEMQPSFILIGFRVSEIHAHLRNVWPEAVYCCFTRTTLFTEMYSMVISISTVSQLCPAITFRESIITSDDFHK